MKRMEGSVQRILNSILRQARTEGYVEKDVTPTLRDGRLVIPVLPAMKRKIDGIVHDESARDARSSLNRRLWLKRTTRFVNWKVMSAKK